jgi:hypothetical protein
LEITGDKRQDAFAGHEMTGSPNDIETFEAKESA